MATTFDELILTVTALNRRLALRLNQRRSSRANTQLQFNLLQILAFSHGARVTKVAEQMQMSVSSATQILRRLERAKLIKRRLNDADRRSVRYEVTSFGQRQLRDRQAEQQLELRRIFRGVQTQQLRQMVAVLERMLKNISD